MRHPISYFLLSSLFFLVSCGEQKTSENNSTSNDGLDADKSKNQISQKSFNSDIIKGKVEKTLSAGENSETSSIYFEYFILDEKSPAYYRSVNELISQSIQNEFEETEVEKITSNLSKKYFADILTEFKINFSHVDENYVPWSLMDSIHIDDSKTEFAHLETFTYSFTGGAHGNGYESHYLIDKKTGKTLGIGDFFMNEKKLNALVDSYFRKSIGISQNENLQDAGWFIEGRLEPNNNFYFTDKKVVFVYNSYEIGPYSAGAPNVEIPISKVSDILKINVTK
jgi:hypothetical protein